MCISWVRFELGFGSILIIFIFYSLCKIILKKVYLFGLDRVRLIFIEFRLNCYGYVLQFYNQNYFFISWFRLWLSHSTMDKKTRSQRERKWWKGTINLPFDEQNPKEKENPTMEVQASAETRNRSRPCLWNLVVTKNACKKIKCCFHIKI